MNNEAICRQFGMTNWFLEQGLQDISHKDSLKATPTGQTLNWVVGHLADARNGIIAWLTGEPAWPVDETAQYKRGSGALGPDEALPLDRKAGHAAQRAGNVAFAGARDFLVREDRDDLGRTARHVAVAAPGNDDFTAAAGDRDFRVFSLFFLGLSILEQQFLLILCGDRLCRILRECGGRESEGGGEQEQPRQLLAGRHDR